MNVLGINQRDGIINLAIEECLKCKQLVSFAPQIDTYTE